MIAVEGGSYLRGSAEPPYATTERVHRASVKTFYLAETETTQALWTAVMGSNPSKFRGAGLPVDFVSWLDAVRFCNALSGKAGLTAAYTISGQKVEWNRDADGYRLPTEAEWEYAARGGLLGAVGDEPLKRAPFAGSSVAEEVAWFDGNSGKATKLVATKKPNELGLFDMSGNVWEWCWDWYGDYPRDAVSDPAGVESGSAHRVLRGGSWFGPRNLSRVTYRYWNVPTFKANSVGFRVARNSGEFSITMSDGSKLDIFDALALPDSEKAR